MLGNKSKTTILNEASVVTQVTRELSEKYPLEAAYGSKASLWGLGVKDKIVAEELYSVAREYYGRLWYYTGD